LLTYTVRFTKVEVQPNITIDHYTIDRYKEGEFVNGQFTIHSKKLINNVSTKYETTKFRLNSILSCKDNSSNYNVVQLNLFYKL